MESNIISRAYHSFIAKIAKADGVEVLARDKVYGSSWKKRGGIGAFMMLARKIDRIETAAESCGWDIFEAIKKDPKATGLIDDIRDLRRYLILVEAEVQARGFIEIPDKCDKCGYVGEHGMACPGKEVRSKDETTPTRY